VRQPESWLQLNALNTFKLGPIRVKNLIGYEDKWDEFQNNLTASAPGSNQPQWNLDDPSTWNQIMPVFPTQWTIAATTGRRVRSETSAYFFTSQISAFEERVVVLGGVRRDDVRATTTDVGKTPVVSQYPLSSTPQAGIVLKPLPGISFYASYAESFVPQFAGQKQRPDTSYFTPDPFTGEGLDIGVKFELLDSRIAGSVTWFELENTNQLQQLPNQIDPATGEQFTPWLQNGATDRSTGIETDLRLMPFKGTQVVLGYGHMRAYHKLDATRPTLVGLPLPDAPRDTFSLWVKQNLGKVGRIDNLALTGGVRYVGERPAGLVVGAWRMDSYMVATLGINGRMRIGKIDYNASLSCRNLFDELYRENVHMFGEPRTVTLTVGVSF
jgi:iron complex outermembrane receptor protein